MQSEGQDHYFITVTTPQGSTVRKVDVPLFTVGRSENCNLRIENPEVGRRHLSFVLRDGQVWVEDHASVNGTFINGNKLEPHQPTLVTSLDQIQLGKLAPRLSVSMNRPAVAVTPEIEAEPPPSPMESSLTKSRLTSPQLSARMGNEMSESMVLDAQKRAARVLQDAELAAERKVQEIVEAAESQRIKSEQTAQRKVLEAFREAEEIYQKAQNEATALIQSARETAAQIRTEAEAAAHNRRAQAETDSERLLDEAQSLARELKTNRLQEADDIIRSREEELLRNTREQMDRKLAEFEIQFEKDSHQRRQDLELELSQKRGELENQIRSQQQAVEDLQRECVHLQEEKTRERSTLEELRQEGDELRRLDAELRQTCERLTEQRESAVNSVSEATNDVRELEARQAQLEEQLHAAEQKLFTLTKNEREMMQKVQAVQDATNKETLRIKEQFQATKVKLEKEEKAHLEQLSFETHRKIRDMESEFHNQLVERRTRIGNELLLTVESFLKQNPNPGARSLETLHELVDQQMQVVLNQMSSAPTGKTSGSNLVTMKRADRWRNRLGGAMIGAVLCWMVVISLQYVRDNNSPLQRQVAAAAEQRALDMELRRFDPKQTPELGPTYTDSVIYTRGFVTNYLNADFQKQLLQSLSPYMLKTWRLDEDVSIQVLAASTSLVQQLALQRQNIHPDFVRQDVQKMHDVEIEATQRMIKILGSQVRFESFKKFEHDFYEQHRP